MRGSRLRTEGVRQPYEATHSHTHGEVLALAVAGGDVLKCRVTLGTLATNPDTFRRTITCLAILGRARELNRKRSEGSAIR